MAVVSSFKKCLSNAFIHSKKLNCLLIFEYRSSFLEGSFKSSLWILGKSPLSHTRIVTTLYSPSCRLSCHPFTGVFYEKVLIFEEDEFITVFILVLLCSSQEICADSRLLVPTICIVCLFTFIYFQSYLCFYRTFSDDSTRLGLTFFYTVWKCVPWVYGIFGPFKLKVNSWNYWYC